MSAQTFKGYFALIIGAKRKMEPRGNSSSEERRKYRNKIHRETQKEATFMK